MQNIIFDKPTALEALPYVSEFWIINTTRNQVLRLSRKYHLTIKKIRNYGRILYLTATGNFQKWLKFIIGLQNSNAVLVLSSRSSK